MARILIFRPVGCIAALALTLPLTSAAFAQSTALDPVYACASIDDSDARLACYDNAVGRLQQAEATGEIRTISRSEVEAVERDAFGFNLPNLSNLVDIFSGSGKSDKPAKRDALTAPVIRTEPEAKADEETTRSVEVTPRAVPQRPAPPPVEIEEVRQIVHGLRKTEEFGVSDRVRFYLDNGQVWDQLGTRRVRIPKERSGQKNTVEIRKAALGSYLLRINGEGAAVRVRRRR